jgi:hypothetical protein
MLGGIFRQQRHMRTTHDNARALRPEPRRKIVSVISARGVKSHGNHIRSIGPIDVFGLFIDVSHFPKRRNQGRQVWHGDLLEI